MTTIFLRKFAALPALAFAWGIFISGSHSLRAAEKAAAAVEAEALGQLEKAAQAYVDAYNARDAKRIALAYTEEAAVHLANGLVLKGRDEIEAYHRDLFERGQAPEVALDVKSVDFVRPEVALESGTFHLTLLSGEVVSHRYQAVQVRQDDGQWRTASVRDERTDRALPLEKLAPLQALLGEWQVERDGITIYFNFDWSAEGPYLVGQTRLEQSGMESSSSTYRIGWDAARSGFISWNFDSMGGFNVSEWSKLGGGAWLLSCRGSTASGESNRSTQHLKFAPDGSSFSWEIRDHFIDGQPQTEQRLVAVRRPPQPMASAAEGAQAPSEKPAEAPAQSATP